MFRLTTCLLLFALLLFPVAALAGPNPQQGNVDGRIAGIMQSMTPEEKVGQLFLVSFRGSSAPPESEIYKLIARYHVGGIVIQSRNDNLIAAPDTAAGLQALINGLQQIEFDASPSGVTDPIESTEIVTPAYIPLFIAMAHEGDGPPYTEILDGVTVLPNAMTLGATWNPEPAEAIGQIAGQELAVLGVNLLLGPSLDVLEIPNPEGAGDLGTRTFGGDSYWVGALGRRYIAGIHKGSGGRVLVAAENFPGQGGSDRKLNDEVPTVRKSLAQLRLIELAPFFAVTQGGGDPMALADALLVTHIRYQGFQGNIRDTTRPVSLDQKALQAQLLALPEIAEWRAQGGLTVSESLGVGGIRRFIDPTGQTFPARLVARDALLAGNDVLQVTDFAAPDLTEFQTLVDTLSFFAQKYGEDEVFAERVDEAVERILRLKLRLYPQFELSRVQQPSAGLGTLAKGRERVSAVAARAATLIFPTLADLDARLPDPPQRADRIVFFTDARPSAQCSTCPAVPMMPVDALQQAVLRFYGPQASGQVSNGRMQSFSFEDLSAFLAAAPAPTPPEGTPTATANPVGEALNNAQWLVFSMLDVTPDVPSSDVVRAFLASRSDLARQKKVVVFAFNAPYYLDATEIGKLAAYYGLYGKGPAFVEVAARLLFREVRPSGASPVSIAGVGYDIVEATLPDPTQVIPICIGESAQSCEATSELPSVKVGDTLSLHTGLIADANGNPVPDSTPVTFTIRFVNESIPDLSLSAVTSGGIASATYPLDRTGLLEIRASSGPATNSWTLQVNAQSDQATIISITPTPLPSPTPPEPTPTQPAPTAIVTPAPTQATIGPVPTPRVSLGDFWLTIVGSLMLGTLGFYMGQRMVLQPYLRLRFALWAVIGTLLGYNYFVLGFPGAHWMDAAFAGRSSLLAAFAGGLAGLVAGWAWWRWGWVLEPGGPLSRGHRRHEGE